MYFFKFQFFQVIPIISAIFSWFSSISFSRPVLLSEWRESHIVIIETSNQALFKVSFIVFQSAIQVGSIIIFLEIQFFWSSFFIFCKVSSKDFKSWQQTHHWERGIVSVQFMRVESIFISQISFTITIVFFGKFGAKLLIRVVFPEPNGQETKITFELFFSVSK